MPHSHVAATDGGDVPVPSLMQTHTAHNTNTGPPRPRLSGSYSCHPHPAGALQHHGHPLRRGLPAVLPVSRGESWQQPACLHTRNLCPACYALSIDGADDASPTLLTLIPTRTMRHTAAISKQQPFFTLTHLSACTQHTQGVLRAAQVAAPHRRPHLLPGAARLPAATAAPGITAGRGGRERQW